MKLIEFVGNVIAWALVAALAVGSIGLFIHAVRYLVEALQ